jgi:hypothetical protein
MAKKVWTADAVSVIILPSGEQGKEILALAEEWSASWLLTPALWMLSDEIKVTEAVDSSLPLSPPKLNAYMLGRDEENNPKYAEVDLFWTLGSQQFKKIRLVAVRTEQTTEEQKRTSRGAQAAERYLSAAIAQPVDESRDEKSGSVLTRINLVVAPTEEDRLVSGVLEQSWDANIVAAAEDRMTPESSDSFVRATDPNYPGFVLAHIATTAGLWSGLPTSSAEIDNGDSPTLRLARLQRVFVRAVASDTLSSDIARWALDRSNDPNQATTAGKLQNGEVRVLTTDQEKFRIAELVEHIMNGPAEDTSDQVLTFKYRDLPEVDITDFKKSISQRLLSRLRDIAEAFATLPAWYKAQASVRLEKSLGEEVGDQEIYQALPNRLAPRVVPKIPDIASATSRPTLAKPSPELWKHVRESIAAGIDSPSATAHPSILKDEDGNNLVFSDVSRVLPDPNAKWNSAKYDDLIAVDLGDIEWLDDEGVSREFGKLGLRLDELRPGLEEARAQLDETGHEVAILRAELQKADSEVSRLRSELAIDVELADEMRDDHTHGLPIEYVGPNRSELVTEPEVSVEVKVSEEEVTGERNENL